MPIETKDLVLYESERSTDNDDGGGKYNGQIIIDGQSNNLFDDVSELDRTMGDVSMRKIFPAVTTNDTDKKPLLINPKALACRYTVLFSVNGAHHPPHWRASHHGTRELRVRKSHSCLLGETRRQTA